MLFGALGQVVLCVLLPTKLATLPAVLLALHTITSSAVQYVRVSHDGPYIKGVIYGETTAQLPERGETGVFASMEPATRPLVVFHFGVRFHHPLGFLSPGGREITDHFFRTMEQVQAKPEHYGLLGVTRWQSGDRDSQNTMMFVFFFKDIEGLRRFTHGKTHSDAAAWVNRTNYKHMGFFHETYCVPRGAYETLYRNMPPTMLGEARVGFDRAEGDGKLGKQYIGTLLSANRAWLKTQFDRMWKMNKEWEEVNKKE
ncbi:hypothetical protein F4820DRAFT_412949 [Hypoxylon rubiginosum]|uniref:Uncharacterized protein n=1 Tax=Hypoxylon rubiginosum TaxID=110542 RepID=A0ACB9Z748_9PEZI|nr:hypothetical protein F4820DRAFT_412949 [Hypoxylon rubiginosum]